MALSHSSPGACGSVGLGWSGVELLGLSFQASFVGVLHHREPPPEVSYPLEQDLYLAFHPVFFHMGEGDFAKGTCHMFELFPPYALGLLEKRTLEMSCHVNTI